MPRSLPARLWPHLRPFVKVLCRILVLTESRISRHAGLESGANYVYERLETFVLLLGVFYGTVLACLTGIITAIILLPYTLITFWPLITTVAPHIAKVLWQGIGELLRSALQSLTGTKRATPRISIDDLGLNSEIDTTAESNAHSNDVFSSAEALGDVSGDGVEGESGSAGSWKVSDIVEQPQLHLDLTSDLYIPSSPTRSHRRTGTGGSSISLSGMSSPELVRTPLIVNTEARDGHRRKYRSGSSSPESYFRMTALNDADRAQSTSDLRRHNRSGSSSTTSIRSTVRTRPSDRT